MHPSFYANTGSEGLSVWFDVTLKMFNVARMWLLLILVTFLLLHMCSILPSWLKFVQPLMM